MTMTFYKKAPGLHLTRDNKFLFYRVGNKWSIFILDEDNNYQPVADNYKSLKQAKEYILNSWYCQHVNM